MRLLAANKYYNNMESYSNFSFSRFFLLFKQYWIYYRKLVPITIFGFVGGLFVLLFSIQIITGFSGWEAGQFIMVFIWIFMVLAIAYAGSSFPGLRSRERGYSYLLLPASITEKFLFEIIVRILLFTVIVPLLYWAVFYLEGTLVAAMNSDFTFISFSFFDAFRLPTRVENNWMIIFTASEGLLFLTVPFKGSTVFMKYPIIKTAVWSIAILFGHLILYYFISKMDIRIFPNRLTGLIFMPSYVLLINIAMLTMAYFKLKGKQI